MTALGARPRSAQENGDPAVFVRPISTPAALPWEQARMAALEAGRTTPIASADLVFRIKRLKPWRPKTQGDYAAVYVRSLDIGSGLSLRREVNGQGFSVRFEPAAAARRRRNQSATFIVAACLCLVSVSVASLSAINKRQSSASQLAKLELMAQRHVRQAQAEDERRNLSRNLEMIDDRGAPMAAVLDDLAWVTRSRNAETPIDAFHWRVGGVAVEVRGDGEPFEPGEAVRIAKPIRPGVWLWVKQAATPIQGPGRD